MLQGTIAIRTVSGFPCVQFERNGETLYATILIKQFDDAQQNMGKRVAFELHERPYGPYICSDNGFAEIIQVLD